MTFVLPFNMQRFLANVYNNIDLLSKQLYVSFTTYKVDDEKTLIRSNHRSSLVYCWINCDSIIYFHYQDCRILFFTFLNNKHVYPDLVKFIISRVNLNHYIKTRL